MTAGEGGSIFHTLYENGFTIESWGRWPLVNYRFALLTKRERPDRKSFPSSTCRDRKFRGGAFAFPEGTFGDFFCILSVGEEGWGGLVAFAVLLIALENKVTFHWGNRRGWRKGEKREEGFAKIQHDKNNLNLGLGRFQSYWRAPPFISPNHR